MRLNFPQTKKLNDNYLMIAFFAYCNSVVYHWGFYAVFKIPIYAYTNATETLTLTLYSLFVSGCIAVFIYMMVYLPISMWIKKKFPLKKFLFYKFIVGFLLSLLIIGASIGWFIMTTSNGIRVFALSGMIFLGIMYYEFYLFVYRVTKTDLSIVIGILIVSVSLGAGVMLGYFKKYETDKEGLTAVFENFEVTTDSNIFYIDESENYLFLYNFKKDESIVYSKEDLVKIVYK